jgi:hypothetical protein
VTERARETGIPERTLYRRAERFEEDGMQSLFGTDPAAARAKRRGLEPAIRRMVVDLKAEHPALNNNEISNIVYVRTGRRLGDHTAARVLSEEVVPLKLSRLFELYHEIEDPEERRGAVVALHLDGWSVKALASYLRVSRKTVYRVLESWMEKERTASETDRWAARKALGKWTWPPWTPSEGCRRTPSWGRFASTPPWSRRGLWRSAPARWAGSWPSTVTFTA